MPASYLPIIDLEECHVDFQAQVPVAGLILQEEDVAGCRRQLGKQAAWFRVPDLSVAEHILTGHGVDPFGCILGFPREVSAHGLQGKG